MIPWLTNLRDNSNSSSETSGGTLSAMDNGLFQLSDYDDDDSCSINKNLVK